MSLITEQKENLLSVIHIGAHTAQSASTAGIQETSGTQTNDFSSSTVADVDVDTTKNLTTGFNTYFKLQGFNPITDQYETWHSMNDPLLDPPSGNQLENITILFTWIDR